jgi:hypothetical protein
MGTLDEYADLKTRFIAISCALQEISTNMSKKPFR